MNLNKIFLILLGMIMPMVITGHTFDTDPINNNPGETEDFSEVTRELEENNGSETGILEIPECEAWEVVTLNGKLRMKGLPVSPGLHIFMVKDSLIELSIKVPLMGEVGRVILTPDSVVGINKMNKTYTEAGLADFLKYYPGGIADVQDLLLGKLVMPGQGIICYENISSVEMFETEEGIAVIPVESIKMDGFDYGYIVDQLFRPNWLLVLPEFNQNVNISINYEYEKDGYDMIVSYVENSRQLSATLELKTPEWKGEALKPVSLGKNYRSLPLGEFIKNFGR